MTELEKRDLFFRLWHAAKCAREMGRVEWAARIARAAATVFEPRGA